jgi:hypothetical protein
MKPEILILLQNFYGNRAMSGRRLRFPVYDTRIINRSNATYSRIVPTLEPHFELFFGECTPMVGIHHTQKFPTDLDWVQKTLSNREWFAVLAFGSQSHQALDDLNYAPFAKLPHPVSFKWRRDLITQTCQDLLAKQGSENFLPDVNI